jgi:glucose-1-phosphate thymidylyltransferase
MRGVLLAGGTGSRLWPLTLATSKQLLPVYDKPMVYYPLSTLMLAGIREVLLISTPRDLPQFQELLGGGSQWAMTIDYVAQERPLGIAQALILAEGFIRGQRSALILGDNIFHGPGLGVSLASRGRDTNTAHIFAYEVGDPRDYAVVTMDSSGKALSLEEKPSRPRSRFAVPGLYFYPADASEVARDIEPSSRGELEITDVNRWYLRNGRLSVTELPRGTAWLDTGTHAGLSDASIYVRVLEERQGMKVSCPEEIAWRQGWISDQDLERLALSLCGSGYGEYLSKLLQS